MLSWALSGSEIPIFLLPFETLGNKITKRPVMINIFFPGLMDLSHSVQLEQRTHAGTDTACVLMLSLKQHLSVTEVMLKKSKACLQLACLCKQEMLVFTFVFRQYKPQHQLQAAVCLDMSLPWGCGEVLRRLGPFRGFLFRTLTGDMRVLSA